MESSDRTNKTASRTAFFFVSFICCAISCGFSEKEGCTLKQTAQFLIRIPAEGEPETVSLPDDVHPDHALLAALLHTDVTERLRLFEMPDGFAENTALLYFIDARGGEKGLPVNFCGTCFYHTGCPIHGDLLLAACSIAEPEGAVRGFTAEEAALLLEWLNRDFAPHTF